LKPQTHTLLNGKQSFHFLSIGLLASKLPNHLARTLARAHVTLTCINLTYLYTTTEGLQ
jgi:hypothetical protein